MRAEQAHEGYVDGYVFFFFSVRFRTHQEPVPHAWAAVVCHYRERV